MFQTTDLDQRLHDHTHRVTAINDRAWRWATVAPGKRLQTGDASNVAGGRRAGGIGHA